MSDQELHETKAREMSGADRFTPPTSRPWLSKHYRLGDGIDLYDEDEEDLS